MKITNRELQKIVLEEVEKLQPELQEGVLDFLRGAGKSAGGKASSVGKSIAKSVGDKATAVKDKVGQVAGDIKTAGSVASLRGDLQRAAQEAGQQVEKLIEVFNTLLARAQSLRLDQEENEIKTELAALKNYQQTAAAPQQSATASKPKLGTEIPKPVKMSGPRPVFETKRK